MFASLPSRAIGAAALAVGVLLSGCSSEGDVPPVVASTPDGGTKMNTDTGSGGTFPDVNTVPTQRPTSTIQDLIQLPEGLPGASSGTQYGEPLVGGPSSSVDRPAPPPPPVEELPPIPEAQEETQSSEAPSEPAPEAVAEAVPEEEPAPEVESVPEETVAEAPAAEAGPISTPEIIEPEMPEPEPQVAEPAPAPEVIEPEMPEPEAEVADTTASDAIEREMTEPEQQVAEAVPAPEPPAQDYPVPQYGDVPMTPESAAEAERQPVAPAEAPQVAALPAQSPTPPAALPASMQPPSVGAIWQQQAAPAAAYGVPPSPAKPYQSAQAMYRSPYGSQPANQGFATYGGAVPSQQPAAAPTDAAYGESSNGGQPVALIFFGDGSASLSSDDRQVLQQIADMQLSQGGIVHVTGHASMRTGSADFATHQQANQRISEARANSVARQLMEYGVSQEAIQIVAAGDSQPLYAETMPTGEAGNRRAEVYLSAN